MERESDFIIMNTPQDSHRFRNQLLTLAACAAVVCLVVLLFFRTEIFTAGVKKALNILMPFIYGAIIAYLIRPTCEWVEHMLERLMAKVPSKKKERSFRFPAILISMILLFVVIILLLLAVLPEMINSISRILSQLPTAAQNFSAWIETLDTGEPSHELVSQIQQALATVTDYVQNFLQTTVLPNLKTMISNVTSSFSNLLGVVKNFGLGLIISAYILGSWEKFAAQIRMAVYGIFPQAAADWIFREADFSNQMFRGFINGKLLDSLIIGIICFLFMFIGRMPYAILIAIIVGVTNIIPFFGPYLGAIPSALLLLTISPIRCLVFLVFIIILQQFDGNVLGPKILGDKLGISSFWILFSILVFGSLWGLVGMLIGAPIFAVLYDIIRTFLKTSLQKRGREDILQEYEENHSS